MNSMCRACRVVVCWTLCLGFGVLLAGIASAGELRQSATAPRVASDVVFEEREGLLAIEAEHFFAQGATGKRAWWLHSSEAISEVTPDADSPHVAGASGGAYLEALPDTRHTHADRLQRGENFFPEPGEAGVLSYRVYVHQPGRYYVWARAFSTGTEDNGLHVGLDGRWPASGQRWQTVVKQRWHWESRQRTAEVHTGVPGQLFLDIEQPGRHVIHVSIREDGFELDKLVLARRPDYRPERLGPGVAVMSGQLPAAFAFVPPPFPPHWGSPPSIETLDYRPLPESYGYGSSTLALWITRNLQRDAARSTRGVGTNAGADDAGANDAGADDAGAGDATANAPSADGAREDGNGAVVLDAPDPARVWDTVTITLDGPYAHERDEAPNPFTDYRFTVAFRHVSGDAIYMVPGYFAADGQAAETSAEAGTQWRAHFVPDRPGLWEYTIGFARGAQAALYPDRAAQRLEPYTGQTGKLLIGEAEPDADRPRSRGRVQYVGEHYLRYAGDKSYFLKAGPDAPETLLAYADFDGTEARKANVPLKSWQPHVQDWRDGDPTWQAARGKGLIGAVNYLASKGMNTFSFLPYNAGGDGDNVWPFVERDAKLHYDCSKLDQWGVVFNHASNLGMHLHFKLQENEIDDNRVGHQRQESVVPESLDGGLLGVERRLYCRELIARFGNALALNWNLGEETTQTSDELRQMAQYIQDTDPYDHPIVVHTFPSDQDLVYGPLLGDGSVLTGASLQNSWSDVHRLTYKWREASAQSGRKWVIANDEQNPASHGVPPDPGYQGHSGEAQQGNRTYTLHDIRKYTLWGNLLAGGAGVEYYFGYQLPENDLVCEDFRSRDRTWDYCRVALEFFQQHAIPFWEMENVDPLVGNSDRDNSRYAFAKPGQLYLVYLPEGGTCELDLSGQSGQFSVAWFNPRQGGDWQEGSVTAVTGGAAVNLGQPPAEADQDWLAVVSRQES